MYESPSTPTTLARYLIGYINDDSTIAAHIKHRFGLEWTKDDIARMRSTQPKKYMIGQGQPAQHERLGEAALGIPFRPRNAKRDDPLLRALASYHYKRSKTKEEQKHWWALM